MIQRLLHIIGVGVSAVAVLVAVGLPVSRAEAAQSNVATERPWRDLSGASSYSFASNRLNFPTMAITSSSTIAGLGDTFNNSPAYPVTNIRFLFANFYVATDGSQNPERRPGCENTIDFATVFVDGHSYSLTFGGASRVVLADGDFTWSDALRDTTGHLVNIPANSSYVVRTSRSAPPGGKLVAGSGNFGVQPRYSHTLGEGVEYTATPQIGKRFGGAVAAYLQGSAPIGPSMAIGTGWDGSAVYLLVGDSIGVGQADYDFSSRGVVGYLERGLDDNSHSRRRNFGTMMISGTKPDDQASEKPGEYELRMKTLRAIPNRPFNAIISEMGQNSPSIAGGSLAAFQATEGVWWEFWHGACPSCRIFQTTFPTHARSAKNAEWTEEPTQITDYPNGVRWRASNWFRQGPLPPYVTVLDVTSAFCDANYPGNWKVAGWIGAVSKAITRGDTHVIVTGTAAPSNGDVVVIDAKTPAAEARNVWSVTGEGPWTASVTNGFSSDHAPGAQAALAYTSDGTHPSATLHKLAATIIETYKASGMLP